MFCPLKCNASNHYIWTVTDLSTIIGELRTLGGDTTSVEVKAAYSSDSSVPLSTKPLQLQGSGLTQPQVSLCSAQVCRQVHSTRGLISPPIRRRSGT